ncbi:MAG TPA: hypothetical protein VLA05_08865, partial [Coriobacteriia bacterium]|nr:hypothetical protein [Coriobacteriia bacterium]
MASNEMTSGDMAGQPLPNPNTPAPLTAREKRRRIVLLILLLALLAALAGLGYYWARNRQMPVPSLGREGEALAPPEFLFSITGTGANRLQKPVGVDVAPDGRVYVVDFGKRRVSVFNPEGQFLFSFNKTKKETLRNPVHLQVKGNEVWVTDRRLKGIYVFGLDGKYIREFKPKNEKLKWTPLALAFDAQGALRATDVGDSLKHRLLYFSQDGSRTVSLGETKQVDRLEAGPGAFYFPNGLAVADDGRVFVADGDNRRVQVFDEKGEFSKFVDTSGVPRGLAIDAEKRLYVVDALAHTVDLYSLDGERLVSFGTRGFGPGEFNFPNDVALDDRGRIYVSDRENNQVQVWAWSALVVPASVVPDAGWQWALCLTPLLLLPLLLLLRKRTYIITPAFLTALDAEGRTDVLNRSRLRFIGLAFDADEIHAMEIEGVNMKHAIHIEQHSETDTAVMRDKLRCTEQQAAYLTMADRARALLSDDLELRRLGITARVRVLDMPEFLEEVGDRRKT